MADLQELASKLTIHEAAALVAIIHEKNTTNKGDRFGLYPVKDWNAFERLKKLEASRWTADEVEFNEDLEDFLALPADKQKPLLMSFGFFAVGDGSIAGSIAYRMILIAPTFEKQAFYICQLDNERTHGETYGKMIHELVKDPAERDDIFHAVERIQSIKNMNKFIEDIFTNPDGERSLLVAMACAEFLMFTPLFCIIFWYRAYMKGKLDKIILSNEQIAKDEALHCLNGCENYKDLSDKYTDEEVHQIVAKVVNLVDAFADDTLTGLNLQDLSPDNVKRYIRVVADDLLFRLGHSELYGTENPFPWMTFIRLRNKTNFYEGTVAEYGRFNMNKAIKTAKVLSGETVDDEGASGDQDDVDENGDPLF